MSARWSTSARANCSGAMYAGVPSTAPARVSRAESSVKSARLVNASPKSITFTIGRSSVRPNPVGGGTRNRFAGLMSR